MVLSFSKLCPMMNNFSITSKTPCVRQFEQGCTPENQHKTVVAIRKYNVSGNDHISEFNKAVRKQINKKMKNSLETIIAMCLFSTSMAKTAQGRRVRHFRSSRPRGFHPESLTEPDVKVSLHPALVIQSLLIALSASDRKD
jgi:hypothetical protein